MKPVQPVGFPKRWRPTPLWTLFRRVSRKGNEGVNLLSVYRDHGVVPRDFRSDNWNRIPDDLSAYQLVRPGDLVVNKMKAWQGSLGVSSLMGIVSPAYFVFSPIRGRYDARFLHYLLRSQPYIDSYGRMSDGIRVDQWDLDAWAFSRLLVPLPEIWEQRRIADFLDRETAQSDALIEKQQTLIERFIERRGAFISHVVDGAEGSRLVPLRRLIQNLDQGWSPNASDWPVDDPKTQWSVLKVGCVNGGVFRPDENKAFAAGDMPQPRFTVRTGDVLVSRGNTRELVGSAATVLEDYPCLMLSDLLYRIRVKKDVVLPKYLSMVLGTRKLRDEIELQARGSSQTMPKISQRILLGLKVPILSLPAQSRVLERISETTTTIDDTVYRAERFIEVARERRAALITAAVTGQFDIASEGAA